MIWIAFRKQLCCLIGFFAQKLGEFVLQTAAQASSRGRDNGESFQKVARIVQLGAVRELGFHQPAPRLSERLIVAARVL
jgi:hypothetical protein